jgi:dienelactone hydrolase
VAELGGAEELSVTMLIGPRVHEARAYHLLPTASALDRLVIVHHGHGDTFTDPSFRMDEMLIELLEAGYAALAMYMPNYGPAPKSPPGVPLDGDRHGPIFSLPNPTSALRAFLEPVAACLHHLRTTHAYLDVHMTGLSGGGWTTALYAAVDPSVRASVHVSGSLPLDLRFGSSVGDEEQNHRPLYADTIGYRDLYTLGACGSGRRQVQVLYERDPCCFSDLQWPEPTGFAAELEEYAGRIGSLLESRLTGSFAIARFDDNELEHRMSPDAIAEVKRTIEGVVPRTNSAVLYADRGRAARARIHANGRYEPVGEIAGVGAGWTHVVATGAAVLFYRREDGRAATVRSDVVTPVAGLVAGWTHVTAVGAEHVLFYDAELGTAELRRLAAEGLEPARAVDDLPPRATHVVGAQSGALLVLDRTTGRATTGQLGADGLVVAEAADPLPAGWTSVTAVNDNVLCFYDARTGSGETVLLDRSGRLVRAGRAARLPKDAAFAVGAANGALLFSCGAVWLVNELGEARAAHAAGGLEPWTAVAMR